MKDGVKKKAKVIIIGTGFSGIASAVRLKQEGENDIIILERGSDVGGVWRDNQYPGAACDVESHLYSLSFAPNPNWSDKFSHQPEIYAYLKDCVRKFNLMEYIRFEHDVNRLDWKDDRGEWIIQTNRGEFTAKIVVGAFGALSDPTIPTFKGIEKFEGDVFHSARWPKSFNPKGKRIAVVGTGASAIQFIPEIQPHASSLYIFQRTPAWVLPRLDGPISETKRKLYRSIPLLRKAERLRIYLRRELIVKGFREPKRLEKVEQVAIEHMHNAINDPILRQKLTPDYRIGCKRILLSNTYYPALAQPNVEVNTSGIAEVIENAVIDSKDNKFEVDAVIFGTGFKVTELPLANSIYGKEGYSLSKEWNGGPRAYMGEIISGFPNLFITQGPNSGLGHSSVIYMIEAQVEHMIQAINYLNKNQLDIIEPSPDAQNRFVEETDRLLQGTVWNIGGCSSWYHDQTGRNSTLWPSYSFLFRKKAIKFNAEDYIGRRSLTSI